MLTCCKLYSTRPSGRRTAAQRLHGTASKTSSSSPVPASTGVLDKATDVDDALVAGGGSLVLVDVEIMISGRWVRWVRGRLIHVNPLSRLAAPRRCSRTCRGLLVIYGQYILLCGHVKK
jgi:hypothetical protein